MAGKKLIRYIIFIGSIVSIIIFLNYEDSSYRTFQEKSSVKNESVKHGKIDVESQESNDALESLAIVENVEKNDIEISDIYIDSDKYESLQYQFGYFFRTKALGGYSNYPDEALRSLADGDDRIALRILVDRLMASGDFDSARNYALMLAELGSTEILISLAAFEEPATSDKMKSTFRSSLTTVLGYYDLMAKMGDINGLYFGTEFINRMDIVVDDALYQSIKSQAAIYEKQLYGEVSEGSRIILPEYNVVNLSINQLDATIHAVDVNNLWSRKTYELLRKYYFSG